MYKLERYMRVKTRNGQTWMVVDNAQDTSDTDLILSNEGEWVRPPWKESNTNEAYVPWEITEVWGAPGANRDITVMHRMGRLLWEEQDPKQKRIAELKAELAKLEGEQ